MRPHPTRRVALPLGTVVLALAIAGCSSSSSAPAAGSATTAASSQPSDSAAATSGGSPSATDSSTPQPTSTASGEAVAQRSIKHGQDAFTLKVYAPHRQGQLVSLDFDLAADKVPAHTAGVSNETKATDLLSTQDSSAMGTAMSGIKRVPNGLSLVDPAAQKRYRPATTDESIDTAVCTPAIPDDMRVGDVYTFSCLYAGVPQNLSSVTITTPAFGSFPHVSIK